MSGTRQLPVDTGLMCLSMLAEFHALAVDPHQLAHEFKSGDKSFGTTEILLAAQSIGLKAKTIHTTLNRLPNTPLPAIATRAGFSLNLMYQS